MDLEPWEAVAGIVSVGVGLVTVVRLTVKAIRRRSRSLPTGQTGSRATPPR